MAKIQVVCYLTHNNFSFLQEFMQIEGIPTESRALNYLVAEYQQILGRIKGLQDAIAKAYERIDELKKQVPESPEGP